MLVIGMAVLCEAEHAVVCKFKHRKRNVLECKRAEKEAERCSKLVHSKAIQPSSNLLSETTFLDPFAAGTLAYYF